LVFQFVILGIRCTKLCRNSQQTTVTEFNKQLAIWIKWGKLNHGSTCTTLMVQLTPGKNFNLEVNLCQNINVQLCKHKVINSGGTMP